MSDAQSFYEGTGRHGGYWWVQHSRAFIDRITPLLLRHLAGCTLVNTSFDSGRFLPGEGEVRIGWRLIPAGAASPPLRSDLHLPWAEYDEWWVFESAEAAASFRLDGTFVNLSGWSMAPAADASPDRSFLDGERERFWRLLEEHSPVAYVSQGDCLLLVTSREPLMADVGRVFARLDG